MQLSQEVQDFVANDLVPAIELLNRINENATICKIVELVNIPPDRIPSVAETLSTEKYRNFGFDNIPTSSGNSLVSRLLDKFPNTHPLRYAPDLPQFETSAYPVTQLSEVLNLEDQSVNLFYFRYAVLFKLSLSDFSLIDSSLLFNWWDGDAIIFPDTLDWLISYSLEEQWYAGRAR